MNAKTDTPITDHLRSLVEQALAAGESKSSLARRSGVARSKISDWLAGKATINLTTADKLAHACQPNTATPHPDS